ncbi:methyltransferase domain-containing protein [Larkinella harenae]
MVKRYREIYDFRANENIASVGAGSGVREVIYSLMTDSLTLYLQDLNPVCLQPETLSQTIRQVYETVGQVSTARFIPIRGKEKETRLPEQFFDKIIVENSLHEFDHPNEMLASIRKNLKPNGQLFIWENISRKPGRKHQGCRKLLFTDESLTHLLNTNGFHFVAKTIVDPEFRNVIMYQFTPE